MTNAKEEQTRLILFSLLDEINMPRPLTEHKFHPVRKWRFDYAWPSEMVAVEIEGGVWSNGRHTRGEGYTDDLVKYNEAALLGWLVLRFTHEQIEDGTYIPYLREALKQRRNYGRVE